MEGTEVEAIEGHAELEEVEREEFEGRQYGAHRVGVGDGEGGLDRRRHLVEGDNLLALGFTFLDNMWNIKFMKIFFLKSKKYF